MQKPTQDERALFELTRKFASENVMLSVIHVVVAHGLFFLSVAWIPFIDLLPIQCGLSVFAGLMMLRCFVIYHDYLHGSILRHSLLADVFFRVFSIVICTPKAVWKETHNYHHAHNSKLPTSHIGSFKTVTTDQWLEMNSGQRLFYRFLRHPINMLLGALTVFLLGLVVSPFFRNMKKNRDALFVFVGYVALALGMNMFLSFKMYFFCLLLPQIIAGTIGSYMFYAQHNFPEVEIRPVKEWSHFHAAMHNSSFMDMHPIMHWFSGNIGYHHIHHLNSKIPFYRLPELMAAIPELAPRAITSLKLSDIHACLSLKLWDEQDQKLVAYGA
jgi:omega-6 fatty acid desaturase (delta-12 desaturase)